MESAKGGATRMTTFDAFFMILSDRESTFFEMLFQLFFRFLFNLLLYVVVGCIGFLFK